MTRWSALCVIPNIHEQIASMPHFDVESMTDSQHKKGDFSETYKKKIYTLFALQNVLGGTVPRNIK